MLGAVGVVAAQVTAATAADMPSALPPAPATEWVLPDFVNTGWYLRGDLGYNWGRLVRAEAAPGFASPSDNSLGNGWYGGLGVGIKSKWLRTDVTIDYHAPLKYDGSVATPGDVTAKISALGALFNGYIDLGTWYGVTPYIGAGAGVAYLRASDYASTVAPPFSGGDHNQWNFAWAGMGGLGYAVSPNLMVDLGYRYIDFGDVKTDADLFGAMTFKDVAAHEVRVGLRWTFSDRPTEQ
jgi:opacity protein-like surface antigen